MEAHPVFWFVCWMCVFASGLLFFSSFFLSFWSSPFLIVILCSWAPGHCSSVFVLVRSCVLFVCVYVGVCVLALVCSCSFLRVLSSPSLIVCAPLFSSIPLRSCLLISVVASAPVSPCSSACAFVRVPVCMYYVCFCYCCSLWPCRLVFFVCGCLRSSVSVFPFLCSFTSCLPLGFRPCFRLASYICPCLVVFVFDCVCLSVFISVYLRLRASVFLLVLRPLSVSVCVFCFCFFGSVCGSVCVFICARMFSFASPRVPLCFGRCSFGSVLPSSTSGSPRPVSMFALVVLPVSVVGPSLHGLVRVPLCSSWFLTA